MSLISQVPLLIGPSTHSSSCHVGVYNSSITPEECVWNTYNFCNAAHVNAKHYRVPEEAELVYLNVIMRHHKRTPDNIYPREVELAPAASWNCTDFRQFNYGGGTTPVFHETYIPSSHPFIDMIWNGTCDKGQLTQEGLEDAIQHGRDFWSVYHGQLGFLGSVNEKDIWIRTSIEARTQQVAGGILYGMDSSSTDKFFPVHTQPAAIDSLVPSYYCPTANVIRNAYQLVPAWTDHLVQNADLNSRLNTTLGTAGLSDWDSWYDHHFDALTARTCHGHPLPCNPTGSCVSQADADAVFALGDFEYNYIWNSAENATLYNQLTFGAMFAEFAANFQSFQKREEPFKLRFYVGHDGSMIRLASGLGFGKATPLRWPALGSEIIMEVWRSHDRDDFVRVIHEGTPVHQLEWVALRDFIALLQEQVPENFFEYCTGKLGS